MQDVNENMDELFRRAAENYPLDTSSKDWNKVQLALQNDQVEPVSAKKDSRGRFLWLLLLLPLGLICNRYVLQSDSNKDRAVSSEEVKTSKILPTEKDQNSVTLKTESQSPVADSESKSPVPDTESKSTVTPESSNTVQSKPGKTQSGAKKNLSGTAHSTEQNSSLALKYNKTSKTNSGNRLLAGNRSSKNQKQNSLFDRAGSDDNLQDNLNPVSSDSPNELFVKTIQVRDPYQLRVDPLDATNKNIVEAETKTKTENKKEKKFYVGVMGGVDATTIRFQKIEDAGYSYGVLLGYALNKKWSIETGIYQNKKIYYTEGEYFNTSKVWMPSNSKITEVSGNCKMIEIPLIVRYTIASSQKSSWFASAGTTSYLMQKEDYDYTYYYGNSGTYATHNRKYNSNSKQLFAAAHISGGYARKLSKTTDLRIEPYIKLPVSGMGIGKLQFVSTGVHLGITRKLF